VSSFLKNVLLLESLARNVKIANGKAKHGEKKRNVSLRELEVDNSTNRDQKIQGENSILLTELLELLEFPEVESRTFSFASASLKAFCTKESIAGVG
jgi:hypothetical protein